MGSHSFSGADGNHLPWKKSLLLDPCEVTLALFGGHDPTDFVEVLEHGRFALSAKLSGSGESLFYFGCYCVGCSEQLLNLRVLLVYTTVHFCALPVIRIMQLNDLGELGVGEMILYLEPGEFGPGALFHGALC